jgi:hypothetical protein
MLIKIRNPFATHYASSKVMFTVFAINIIGYYYYIYFIHLSIKMRMENLN